jgi:F-type H+-transporting ATPase subunit epsilon
VLTVDIVAPAGRLFRGEARSVRAPGVLGAFEVRTNHAPLLALLGSGRCEVMTPDGAVQKFAIGGGYLEVLDNVVTVLSS